jgi:hypothetical protein
MSLDDYTVSTPSSIAFELLDRVDEPELLKSAINSHVDPFVGKKELNLDEMLSDYCMELLDRVSMSSNVNILVFEGIPESIEDRIIAIIDCVSSNNAKLDIVLELMSRVTIPWSGKVQDIIYKAFTWVSERRLGDLQEHYRLIQMKKMLLKYELTGFNIQDYSFTSGSFLIKVNCYSVVTIHYKSHGGYRCNGRRRIGCIRLSTCR